ncbi:NAD(P)-binding domain-containing protein [Nocardioides cavernaquae]|nr:NAD(P)-binding domain-containing protein [Nocardioides cavernaquae]
MTTYGILGVGSIASAIVTGLCDGVSDAPEIVLSPRNADRAAALASTFPSVRTATTNQAVVDASDVVLVCVLPEQAPEVLRGLAFRADHRVVSAVAGLPLGDLAALVAPAQEIARSIPLMAVATRGGTTPVFPATPSATTLYDLLGTSLHVDTEATFDAIVGASATVAAYFDYLGTITAWLADRGLAPGDAGPYVAATFASLTDELSRPEVDFGALAQAHTTPGGLNEQFARDLRQAGITDAVRRGLDRIHARVRG